MYCISTTTHAYVYVYNKGLISVFFFHQKNKKDIFFTVHNNLIYFVTFTWLYHEICL